MVQKYKCKTEMIYAKLRILEIRNFVVYTTFEGE